MNLKTKGKDDEDDIISHSEEPPDRKLTEEVGAGSYGPRGWEAVPTFPLPQLCRGMFSSPAHRQ